ncbi:MAG: (d)CMP kinase [Acetobacterales bacterium]
MAGTTAQDRAEPFVIAIDGPAASGKGTLGRRLAAHYGLAYLDTGRLYRAVAAAVLAAGADPGDARAAEQAARTLTPAALEDPDLRSEAVGNAASTVAAIPAVREALLDFQRSFAAAPPPDFRGAVLDGRDIGTVVCPRAHLKLFVTASPEVRAERRYRELVARGETADRGTILADILRRDRKDAERSVAPLAAAADALAINTDALDADAVFALACRHVDSRIPKPT